MHIWLKHCLANYSQDLVLCRSFRGLQKRIAEEGGLHCQVQYWAGAWEVEEIFSQL
jgi:pyridoxal phosphate phosphatase PHOSPHO2